MVEDDESTREMTSLALSCEGFGVVSAKDAEAAWQALRDGRPDLILVDLHMPNLDGLGFVDELHRHEEWGSIPVLVVSAEPHLERGMRGHGVDGVVSKPFDLDDLFRHVREVIAR